MNKHLTACSLAALCIATSPAWASEAEIKKSVSETFGANAVVDAVRKTDMPNIFEVQIGTEIIYADEHGEHLILGNILDVKSKTNVTEQRRSPE